MNETGEVVAEVRELLRMAEQLDPVGARYTWTNVDGVLTVVRMEPVFGVTLKDAESSHEVFLKLREGLRSVVRERVKAMEAEVEALEERAREAESRYYLARMVLPDEARRAEIKAACARRGT